MSLVKASTPGRRAERGWETWDEGFQGEGVLSLGRKAPEEQADLPPVLPVGQVS